MKRVAISIVLVLGALWLGSGMAGCCKQNASKTAACNASKSSDECKTCCGGNYSYTGAGSCTCY